MVSVFRYLFVEVCYYTYTGLSSYENSFTKITKIRIRDQSSSSARMVFSSSLLSGNSGNVVWIRLYNLWLYLVLRMHSSLGLVGGSHQHRRFWLVGRIYTFVGWDHSFSGCRED